jgi:(2R)-sulfolactate sulfo-lyase subunit alpha
MSAPQLLVHDKKDTVGVVVVEGLAAGTDMLCVVTADDSSFRLKSRMDVPIGHKVALADIKAGDTVWKYGQDIGKAVADIAKGDHVHVHNLKTKRNDEQRQVQPEVLGIPAREWPGRRAQSRRHPAARRPFQRGV